MFLVQVQKIKKVHLLSTPLLMFLAHFSLISDTHIHEPEVLTRPNFHTSLIRELIVVEPK